MRYDLQNGEGGNYMAKQRRLITEKPVSAKTLSVPKEHSSLNREWQ